MLVWSPGTFSVAMGSSSAAFRFGRATRHRLGETTYVGAITQGGGRQSGGDERRPGGHAGAADLLLQAGRPASEAGPVALRPADAFGELADAGGAGPGGAAVRRLRGAGDPARSPRLRRGLGGAGGRV